MFNIAESNDNILQQFGLTHSTSDIFLANHRHNPFVHVDIERFHNRRKIGIGNFGTVYHAKLDGHRDVAIKTLNNGYSTNDLNNPSIINGLLNEANIMAQLNHPNLLSMIGVTIVRGALGIVTDYMWNGSLKDYFRTYKSIFQQANITEVNQCLNQFARQIHNAMVYLEQNFIIHRDLAARNCLLDAYGQIKVADFGFTKFTKNGIYTGNHQTICAIRWTAPEALSLQLYSPKSDVWSYGIVLWEIYTLGQNPYGDMSERRVQYCVEQLPIEQILLEPYFGSTNIYHNLILRCLRKDLESRPFFCQLQPYVDMFLT
ncbi:unnamed protein product [Didymodactylos carnosus]|uniref:Protein kinase domain-containing protein n=1 Tax=Didymodactylos carnosus TaxID=1234261 RepID=A0A815ATA1_9BILA|nr:unnamed protein product [Didymodactylos carnosus]CAF1261272.1 unnamed protein product [Didymodactylos carnosus]CAF3577050.1 unnamed protein product [Didymodactylos carnosus]CAF4039154.1 unnamed protein product [Didymodactylos carnosus]